MFQAADTERTGSIGGARAVEFFRRSKVPIQMLRQIWTVADQPPSNALDPRKFAVAVRLIQLEQNGIQPPNPSSSSGSPTDLAIVGGPHLRPAFFEGIPVPPMGPPRAPSMGASMSSTGGGPPPPQGVSHQLVVQDPYTLTPQERARYDQVFPEYCQQDPNYMFGAEAVALFSKSGLEQQQLSRIWAMADDPVDNKLDRLEFAIAMHLIVCVSKKNLPMPPFLPPSLQQLKAAQQQDHAPPQGPPTIQRVGTQDGSVLSSGAGSGGGGGGPMMMGGRGGGPPPPMQVGMNGGSMAPQGIPTPQGMMMNQSQRNMMPAPQQNMMQAPLSPPGQRQSMMQQPPLSPLAQQQSMMQQQAPISPPQQYNMQASAAMPQPPSSSSAGGIPSPDRFAGGVRPPVAGGMSSGSMNFSGMPGPPPITQQTGGTSISDAFEGLVGGGDTGSISSYRATTPYEQQQMYQHNNGNEQSPKEEAPEPAQVSRSMNDAAPPQKTTKQLAASYKMGDTHEELEKLKAILQKLQAENISLKARMGSMTDEEKDVQRELSATVSEVSALSNELTTLRAQVLASKSRLLEASAELKATKEKKVYVLLLEQCCLYL